MNRTLTARISIGGGGRSRRHLCRAASNITSRQERSRAMRRAILVVIPLLFALACSGNSTTGPSPTLRPHPTTSPTPEPTPQATPTHTLTITASPSCTALPDVVKKRTYPAQFQEKPNGDLLVLVVNSSMVGWGASEAGFTGKHDGNTVRFSITDDVFTAHAMVERIPGVGDVGYVGTATGTIDNGKIVATFDGEYRLRNGSAIVSCAAADHRMEITPAGR